jgi:hypothetical protein
MNRNYDQTLSNIAWKRCRRLCAIAQFLRLISKIARKTDIVDTKSGLAVPIKCDLPLMSPPCKYLYGPSLAASQIVRIASYA